MADKRREKTKTDRFQLLLLPGDDKSRTAFVPKAADNTDARTVEFMLVLKQIRLNQFTAADQPQ